MIFLLPLFTEILGSQGEEYEIDIHLFSYFLHVDQLWLSVLIANYCKKKVLGSRNVLIYGYSNTS